MAWLCRVLGHIPVKLDVAKLEATCKRCHKTLDVSYDMARGETVVLRVKAKPISISDQIMGEQEYLLGRIRTGNRRIEQLTAELDEAKRLLGGWLDYGHGESSLISKPLSQGITLIDLTRKTDRFLTSQPAEKEKK